MARSKTHVSTEFTQAMRDAAFTPAMIFSDPRIKAWRKLSDRENCTWSLPLPGGRMLNLHLKRFPAIRGFPSPGEDEAHGLRALEIEKIPSARLVAWGVTEDRRSFVITEDLAGFYPADKLLKSELHFETVLKPLAQLTASLHQSGLHHRDLYLCHFFVRPADLEIRLIDAARVRRLPGFLTRRRWIVKDLAQFWFSTLDLPISDDQRRRWLSEYGRLRKIDSIERLRRAVERKSRWIAGHDAKLRESQPNRNISIDAEKH